MYIYIYKGFWQHPWALYDEVEILCIPETRRRGPLHQQYSDQAGWHCDQGLGFHCQIVNCMLAIQTGLADGLHHAHSGVAHLLLPDEHFWGLQPHLILMLDVVQLQAWPVAAVLSLELYDPSWVGSNLQHSFYTVYYT